MRNIFILLFMVLAHIADAQFNDKMPAPPTERDEFGQVVIDSDVDYLFHFVNWHSNICSCCDRSDVYQNDYNLDISMQEPNDYAHPKDGYYLFYQDGLKSGGCFFDDNFSQATSLVGSPYKLFFVKFPNAPGRYDYGIKYDHSYVHWFSCNHDIYKSYYVVYKLPANGTAFGNIKLNDNQLNSYNGIYYIPFSQGITTKQIEVTFEDTYDQYPKGFLKSIQYRKVQTPEVPWSEWINLTENENVYKTDVKITIDVGQLQQSQKYEFRVKGQKNYKQQYTHTDDIDHFYSNIFPWTADKTYGSFYLNFITLPTCSDGRPTNISFGASPLPQPTLVNGGYSPNLNNEHNNGYQLVQGTTYTLDLNPPITKINWNSCGNTNGLTDITCNDCQTRNAFNEPQCKPFYYTSNVGTTVGTFYGNYTVTVDQGVSDITITRKTDGSDAKYDIKVLSSTPKTYTLNIAKSSSLGTVCPDYQPIYLYVGGQPKLFESKCTVALPAQIQTVFPGTPQDATGAYLLGGYFPYVIKTSKEIIIGEGVNLGEGTSLILLENNLAQGDGLISSTDPDLLRNFSETRVYDENGVIVNQTRAYANDAGLPQQLQSKNITKGLVVATQTLYDRFNRPVINTLPAPLSPGFTTTVPDPNCPNETIFEPANGSQFVYNDKFITSGGTFYDYKNFDLNSTKTLAPDAIETTTPGTLGWYYSNNNKVGATVDATKGEGRLIEPLVPATSFPYSRSVVYDDGSERVKTSTMPGDAFQLSANKLVVSDLLKMPSSALTTDARVKIVSHYLTIRNTYVLSGHNNKPTNLDGLIYVEKVTDEEGNETNVYTDKEGKALISHYLPTDTKNYTFYDDMGRVVCTISPNGVEQLTRTTPVAYTDIDKTTYKYNARGLLIETNSIDKGMAKFMYRKDGAMRFSQNAEQAKVNSFSYVNYDDLGRITEGGVFIPSNGSTLLFNPTALRPILENLSGNDGLVATSGTRSEVYKMYYDTPDVSPGAVFPDAQFTVGKLAWSENHVGAKSHFSYDERGRVVEERKYLPGLDVNVKSVKYLYNSIGSVKQVSYQYGQTDAYYHYYTYDADGRMKEAYSGAVMPQYNYLGEITNLSSLTKQAEYEYYLHGPVKNVKLADGRQKLDYVYTAQGWLKSINNSDNTKDPGGDINDLFGMTYDYYTGDYSKSGVNIGNATFTTPVVSIQNKYNGLIASQQWYTQRNTSVSTAPKGAYIYQYDALKQLKNAVFNAFDNTSATFKGDGTRFKEGDITYDQNGNIKTLNRYDATQALANGLTYTYETNKNRLQSVSGYAIYTYDDLGRIKSYTKSGTTLYPKFNNRDHIEGVYKAANFTQPLVEFAYDNEGMRYRKTSYTSSGSISNITYYVYFNGKLLAIYEQPAGIGVINKTETPVYGSDRVGTLFAKSNTYYYELKDHLGNVRSTFSVNSTGTLEVASSTDYYPYGLPFNAAVPSDKYRNGYQGQFAEKDEETGWNSFQLRMYDPTIGRWMGTDPKGQYPSAYIGMGNNPVSNIDSDGGEDGDFKLPNPDGYSEGTTYYYGVNVSWTKKNNSWVMDQGVSSPTLNTGDLNVIKFNNNEHYTITPYVSEPMENPIAETYFFLQESLTLPYIPDNKVSGVAAYLPNSSDFENVTGMGYKGKKMIAAKVAEVAINYAARLGIEYLTRYMGGLSDGLGGPPPVYTNEQLNKLVDHMYYGGPALYKPPVKEEINLKTTQELLKPVIKPLPSSTIAPRFR